jgi:glycosyltransferase involved in cell wall biosynthesis
MSSTLGEVPRVSVLMTVYNAERFLQATMDSLLRQSFLDWELIAVDDGSQDSSAALLAGYGDTRIRIDTAAANIGRTPALRRAFDQARGQYIAVLDADDLAATDRFAKQVAYLDANRHVALVGSWVKYIDEHGREFEDFTPPANPGELHDSLGWFNPIVHSSAMYRRDMAAAVGGYSLDLAYAQDFGLVLALAERYRIGMIEEFLCSWRIVSSSMSRSPRYGIARGHEGVMNFDRASTLPLSAAARRRNRQVRSIAKVELGVAMCKYQSLLSGVPWIIRGVVSDPTVLWNNGVVKRLLAARAR